MRNNQMNSTNASISKLRENKSKELAFAIQKTHTIDDSQARIAIRVEPIHQNRLTEDNLEIAIAKQFPKVRYQKNSLHKMGPNMFGVFVARNDRTMSLEHAQELASSNEMVKINDTVYQDVNDDIWSVQSDGEHSYLIAQIPDNINDLIGGLQLRKLATASHGLHMEEDFGPGRPMMFYDTKNAEIAFGIAVDGSRVFNPQRKALQTVESAHVLIVDDVNRLPIETASDKEDLLEYMTMLYGQNAEFLAEIKEIINKQVEV